MICMEMNDTLNGVGLHKDLVNKIQLPLNLYAEANHCNLSLCVLAVKPSAMRLHKLSVKSGNKRHSHQSFKPVSIKMKADTRGLSASFLRECDEAIIRELNMLSPRKSSVIEEAGDGDSPGTRKSSLPARLEDETDEMWNRHAFFSECESTFEYANLDLYYPLSHFKFLYKRGMFLIESIKLVERNLVISCVALSGNKESSADGAKSIAKIPVDSHFTMDDICEEWNNDMEISADMLFNSRFYKTHKETIDVYIYEEGGEHKKSFGLIEYGSTGQRIDQWLFMRDIDAHILIHSDNVCESPVINMNADKLDQAELAEFNAHLHSEFDRLKSYLMKHRPDFAKNFDWDGFNHQLFNHQEMGCSSAREFFVLLFVNFCCGRSEKGFASWMFQHGSTNYYEEMLNVPRFKKHLTQKMQRHQPDFPAINGDTKIGVINSSTELKPDIYQGMEILALYHILSKNIATLKINTFWQQQIQAYSDVNNPNHLSFKTAVRDVKAKLNKQDFSLLDYTHSKPGLERTLSGRSGIV